MGEMLHNVVSKGQNWGEGIDVLLQEIAWALQSSANRDGGYSPRHNFFQRDAILQIEAISDWKVIRHIKMCQPASANVGRINHPYTRGDQVLIVCNQDTDKSDKLASPTDGLYWVGYSPRQIFFKGIRSYKLKLLRIWKWSGTSKCAKQLQWMRNKMREESIILTQEVIRCWYFITKLLTKPPNLHALQTVCTETWE